MLILVYEHWNRKRATQSPNQPPTILFTSHYSGKSHLLRGCPSPEFQTLLKTHQISSFFVLRPSIRHTSIFTGRPSLILSQRWVVPLWTTTSPKCCISSTDFEANSVSPTLAKRSAASIV